MACPIPRHLPQDTLEHLRTSWNLVGISLAMFNHHFTCLLSWSLNPITVGTLETLITWTLGRRMCLLNINGLGIRNDMLHGAVVHWLCCIAEAHRSPHVSSWWCIAKVDPGTQTAIRNWERVTNNVHTQNRAGESNLTIAVRIGPKVFFLTWGKTDSYFFLGGCLFAI